MCMYESNKIQISSDSEKKGPCVVYAFSEYKMFVCLNIYLCAWFQENSKQSNK